MWDHGGWDIVLPVERGPDEGGVEEPLDPKPSPPGLHVSSEFQED